MAGEAFRMKKCFAIGTGIPCGILFPKSRTFVIPNRVKKNITLSLYALAKRMI
jgi:hypothetical protein